MTVGSLAQMSGTSSALESNPDAHARGINESAHGTPDTIDDFMADLDGREDTLVNAAAALDVGPDVLELQEDPQEASDHVAAGPGPLTSRRRYVTSLRLVALLLLVGFAVASWRVYALGLERDALARELQWEANANRQARVTARNAEVQLASARRQLLEERMGTQQQRLASQKRQAEAAAPQPKTTGGGCETPRSILHGKGL